MKKILTILFLIPILTFGQNYPMKGNYYFKALIDVTDSVSTHYMRASHYRVGVDMTNFSIATNSTGGFLTRDDWQTFNLKESVLTFSNGLTRTLNVVKNDFNTGLAGNDSLIFGANASEKGVFISTLNATKGGFDFGTTSVGENVNIIGTLGAEVAAALTGNSGGLWTLSNTGGYTQPNAFISK